MLTQQHLGAQFEHKSVGPEETHPATLSSFYLLLSSLMKERCTSFSRRGQWPTNGCQFGRLIGDGGLEPATFASERQDLTRFDTAGQIKACVAQTLNGALKAAPSAKGISDALVSIDVCNNTRGSFGAQVL